MGRVSSPPILMEYQKLSPITGDLPPIDDLTRYKIVGDDKGDTSENILENYEPPSNIKALQE